MLLITVSGLIGVATTAFAQVEQGTVTGVITDQFNAVIVGGKVVLTNADTRVAATTSTNQQGNYTFPYTPPGHYSVSAEMQGFSAATVNNIGGSSHGYNQHHTRDGRGEAGDFDIRGGGTP